MPRRLTPVQIAELEHEELEDRSVEQWGHPRNCTYCMEQRIRELEDDIWRGNAFNHGKEKEA